MPRSSARKVARNVGRIITFVGEHEGNLMFTCPSFTTQDVVYEIVFNRGKAEVYCDCMDAVCREKVWYVFADNKDICKHIRSLREHVLPMLQKMGVL